MGKKLLTIGLLLITSLAVVKAQKIVELNLPSGGKSIIADEIYWFEDIHQKYDLTQLHSNAKLFQPLEVKTPNFGYTESTYWFKFKIKNTSIINRDFFIDITYPALDSVYLFFQNDDGSWGSMLSGDLIPQSQKPLAGHHIVFPISIQNQKENVFYLKARSTGSILLPIWIHDSNSLRESQIVEDRFYFLYYGILLVMIFYNLFIFISLRDINYILYSVTILFNMLFQASLLGHISLLLEHNIWFVNLATPVFIYVFMTFLLVFTLRFLEIKKISITLFRILAGLAILWTIMAFLSFIIDNRIIIRLLSLSSFGTSLLVLFSSVFTLIKGKKSARFYVLAWLVYLVGAIMFALRGVGVLPDVFFTKQGILIGSMIEVVVISFALADKINIYRKEKEEAQSKNFTLIQNQKSELENKVQERTKALQQKQEEVLAQNEELLQNQEELNTQREFIEQKNRELELKNTQIEQSIRVAEDIQQAVLPSEQKLASLFSDYFIFYKPKDIVSGDFYWLAQQNDAIWLIAADCTGHGVPGAFMTLLGNNLFDKLINVFQIKSPAEVIKKLDEEIRISLNQEEKRGHQGMDLVVVKFQYNLNNSIEINFSGANNSLYIFSSVENTLKEFKGNRAMVGGVHSSRTEFENQFITVSRGDKLYLCSDGFQDQHNLKRKRFGKENFKMLLKQNALKAFSEQKKYLKDAHLNFMKDTDQRDDILVMGIEL